MAPKKEIVKLVTPPFRISFPHCFVAEPGPDGGAKKFGGTAIWRPGDFTDNDKKQWQKIKDALNDESVAAFKKKWAELDPEVYKRGLRKGETKEMDGFGPGTIFASLTSKFRPGVVTINGVDVSPEEGNEHLLYAGCLCRATVNVYSYDVKGGKGVAIGLKNLQIISSDEAKYPRLDGRGNAADDFDDDLDSQWLEEDDDFGGDESSAADDDY